MLRYMKLILGVLFFVPALVQADLTGVWRGDDGGTYYLRQSGNMLHWYGERAQDKPQWSNVFHGKIRDNRIKGEWLDVPKGRTMGKGKMSLSVEANGNVLVATNRTGGFGGAKWTREGYSEARPPVVKPMPRPQAVAKPRPSIAQVKPPMQAVTVVQEDCLGFNPSNIELKQINGRWKIVDGSHWMFDFDNKRDEARMAHRILRRYRADQTCYVGRPDPSLTYLLAGGAAPKGGVSGEDCIAFDPQKLSVKNAGGRWKLVEGESHWMFDFGSNKAEAEQAYAVIRKHGFSHSCFIGRPDPSFSYLRR